MVNPERSKILWRCRRGIREMDLLFSEYVSEHLESLDDAEFRTLEKLLDEADLDIMNWIMGRSEPASPDYRPIIERMRVLKNRSPGSN
ncbi:MAG: succinate dehydrogenase assembly factor 2 [Gammaproteobacteria bacterium]|nr:succinate dehydrogenase assembly factor 2 [Gammaproteobacteria bacterium]